jgi:quaternary ammonium compound-resistance protein SugE
MLASVGLLAILMRLAAARQWPTPSATGIGALGAFVVGIIVLGEQVRRLCGDRRGILIPSGLALMKSAS